MAHRSGTGEKASEIRVFTDLLLDEQQQAAHQKLDGLVTDELINIAEWQLLQIASDLWSGRIEPANQLSQDFLAQPAGSSLASACHLLRKATCRGESAQHH